jgi:hypothetical protein
VSQTSRPDGQLSTGQCFCAVACGDDGRLDEHACRALKLSITFPPDRTERRSSETLLAGVLILSFRDGELVIPSCVRCLSLMA